jgi:GNAT superfamily N-acetyltransferase
MWVGEIDVSSDDELRRWWEAAREGDAYERPYAAFWSLQEAGVALQPGNTVMEQHPLVAREGDDVLGTNQVMLPLLDNTHVAFMTPITRPGARGQGVGTALLEAGLELVRSRGRSSVIVEVHRPMADDGPAQTPGTQLLAKHGFTEASRELHRVLELPVADQRLAELEAASATFHDGYTFVAMGSRVPDELIDGYCALQVAFNAEAPLGDLDLEPEVWNEERVRESEERFARQGRSERSVAAIAPDGTMVAVTEMVTTEQQPEIAWQGGTLVLKEHRGHRLGMAVKVANVRAFQAEFHAARVVHSWNAEENGPMVAINDRLGYRPVEYLSEMQRKL